LALEREKIQPLLEEWLTIAEATESSDEQAQALARLSWLIADQKPSEAIEFANRADELSNAPEIEELVEDSRAIAYRVVGDSIRAKQHLARAIYLRKAAGATFRGLMRNLRFGMAQSAMSQVHIDPSKDGLDKWILAKTRISTDDLRPSFGDFISNDRNFYREVEANRDMLVRRLKARLSKPDNYLLLADPGSGKSFFVKQFRSELERAMRESQVAYRIFYLERNLSAYRNIEEGFTDIVMDLIVPMMSRLDILLFIDEVDTELEGAHIFQRLIAPMNGDPFFFLQKQMSFEKQNLVVFFALSSKEEKIEEAKKWSDFRSRIPDAHRIHLPKFDDPIDRIYRAVSQLQRGAFPVKHVQGSALLYIGLRAWRSSRELEQALELAKTRIHETPPVLELRHIGTSHEDIEKVSQATGFDLFAFDYSHILEISKAA
jgi:hypothetical protein